MERVSEDDQCALRVQYKMAEKKKYSILIVAYETSLLLILSLVNNLKKENPSVTVHLLTNRKMDSVTCELKDYVDREFRIHECHGSFWNKKIPGYLNKCLFLLPFVRLSLRSYDIVNIHFAKPKLLKAMRWIQKMTKNIVITPWGSDVLRLDDENAINRMRSIYACASSVTCNPTSQLGSAVVEKFKYDPLKMVPLRWGLDYVDFIEEVKPNKSVQEAKERFGVANRYVISCGYSTAPSHRHEAIIDAVNSIKEQLPDNLTLLFPFTYGWGTPQYVQSIKDKCASMGIKAVYVEEYLSMEDLYMLRMATDMFVHVQTSDAGASCVMQYILCHKKIVHGSWMKYVDLEQYKPLFYYPVDNLENLGEVILEAYRSDGIAIPDEVIKTIMDKGWNKEAKRWDSFFGSLAKKQ